MRIHYPSASAKKRRKTRFTAKCIISSLGPLSPSCQIPPADKAFLGRPSVQSEVSELLSHLLPKADVYSHSFLHSRSSRRRRDRPSTRGRRTWRGRCGGREASGASTRGPAPPCSGVRTCTCCFTIKENRIHGGGRYLNLYRATVFILPCSLLLKPRIDFYTQIVLRTHSIPLPPLWKQKSQSLLQRLSTSPRKCRRCNTILSQLQ